MPETIDRLRAALADRLTIERQVGAGGMATVYLAEDRKHHRQVALKVLNPEVGAALGTERFLREIEIAARLQHPHILPVYDSGEAEGFLYYVMPFVEGESLRSRLEREKQLPVEDALRITREVADALSYAHSRGIVHRDIKPENILLEAGHAVVADFGIARAVSAAGGEHLTKTGIAVGTPTYMSPEQAAGEREVDGRSDVYSLGCVLFEMLTGQPPFTGATAETVVRQHLMEPPPPVTRLRPAVPAAVAGLIERALAKTPADRFSPAAQFAEALGQIAAPARVPTPGARRPRSAIITAVAVAALAIVGAGLGILALRGGEERITTGRTVQLTHEPGLELDPALSPDGKFIAYAAGSVTQMKIYVRQIAGERTVPLTERVPGHHRWPRWSPDGQHIAFQSDSGIYVIPALGGTPRLLAERRGAAQFGSAAWSPDGRALAYKRMDTLYAQSIDGGARRPLAIQHEPHSPSWSPDGTRIAFVSGNWNFAFGTLGNIAGSELGISSADGARQVRLTDATHLNTSPVWGPDGNDLFFVSTRDGVRDVYRMPVAASGQPRGEAERLTTGVNAHTISLAADGNSLAYSVFTITSNIWSITIPETGTAAGSTARQVTSGAQAIEGIGVSPDGQWLVFDSNRGGNQDIYKLSLTSGDLVQLTTDPADDFLSSWSADGQEIAFYSLRTGNRDLFVMSSDGRTQQQVTNDPAQEGYPDWAPDGRTLVFHSDKTGQRELWLVSRSLRGGAWETPRQLTRGGGQSPRWAPDGRLIAYVRAAEGPTSPADFPQGRELRVISPDGAESRLVARSEDPARLPSPVFPEWSPDSRTVYYKASDASGRASFWSVPASGGTPRLLVRFDDPGRESRRSEFTTDGRRLYFTVTDLQSDIWLMELRRSR
jgi:serine/threonine-protein kinase